MVPSSNTDGREMGEFLVVFGFSIFPRCLGTILLVDSKETCLQYDANGRCRDRNSTCEPLVLLVPLSTFDIYSKSVGGSI